MAGARLAFRRVTDSPLAGVPEPPIAGEPSRFHVERRTDLRRSPPWHPLAYIIEALPAALADLARDLHTPPGATVVDFGCAELPYRHFFSPDVRYLGADLPGNAHASVEITSAGTLPLRDASADVVLSTQVLEHVADPALYLAEAHRVLRPGGRMLLSTHGMMVYHPDPVDFWRWTCAGLRRAVTGAGFRVVRFEGVMGLAATGIQLVQDAALSRVPRRLRPGFALATQSLVRGADRIQGDESRRLNALVFALVAERP